MNAWLIVLIVPALLLGLGALAAFAWLRQASLKRRIRRLRRRGDLPGAARLTKKLVRLERRKLWVRRLLGRPAGRVGRTAAVLRETGELDEAERLLDEALGHNRRAQAESTRSHAQLLADRAALHIYRGAVANARPLLEQALAIERALARERPPASEDGPSLGRVVGALVSGIDPDIAQVGTILVKLGAVYQAIGDYAAAAAAYEEARLEFARRWWKPREEIGELLANTGGLFLEMDDLDRAGPVLGHAAEYRRRLQGTEHPKFATAILDLAVWHERKGQYSQALDLMRQSVRIRARALGEGHPDSLLAVNHLARALCAAGDYKAARPLAEQALAGRRAFGEEHPLHAQALATRARLDVIDGRPGDALARLRLAAAAERRAIGRVFAVTTDVQRLGYLEKVRQRLDTVLSLVRTHLARDPAAVAEALDQVLTRKGLAAEAAAARRDAVLGGRYPHLADKLRELSTLRQQIAARTLAGPGEDGPEAHRRLLEGWQARQAVLEVELAGAIPELALEQRLLDADRRAVARNLPAGSALVEFVRFALFDFLAAEARGERAWKPNRYLAFVLRPEAPDRIGMIDLGEAGEIDQLVRDFRTELLGGDAGNVRGMAVFDDGLFAEEISEGPGAKLRQRLFDPIRPALGGARQVVLAPDGELTRLPFEVLPGPDGRPLIEDYLFVYLAVGRDLLRKEARRTEPGAPLVIAGPDFDLGTPQKAEGRGQKAEGRGQKAESRQGSLPSASCLLPSGGAALSRDLDREAMRFPPLPGTLAEGRQVATLLNVQPAVGPAAVESRLKGAASPRILHVATHGFFLPDPQADGDGGIRLAAPENPLLRSGLALAGANTWLKGGTPPAEAEDGLLTAEDVTGLDLAGTELVVLSACETGLGQVRAGEGVFGLRRAFQLAGAHTVVMSLWKVPDGPTQELIPEFFRHLLAGVPRAEALRQAQLGLRQRYPDPRAWGAFVLQGDASPLQSEVRSQPDL
jgi:CHAT domain-containing protein/tetratricopeptide (TPR) repeat protein